MLQMVNGSLQTWSNRVAYLSETERSAMSGIEAANGLPFAFPEELPEQAV